MIIKLRINSSLPWCWFWGTCVETSLSILSNYLQKYRLVKPTDDDSDVADECLIKCKLLCFFTGSLIFQAVKRHHQRLWIWTYDTDSAIYPLFPIFSNE